MVILRSSEEDLAINRLIVPSDGAGRGAAQWQKAAYADCTRDGYKPQHPSGSSVDTEGSKPKRSHGSKQPHRPIRRRPARGGSMAKSHLRRMHPRWLQALMPQRLRRGHEGSTPQRSHGSKPIHAQFSMSNGGSSPVCGVCTFHECYKSN